MHFNYNYFGKSYLGLYISKNGYVSFGTNNTIYALNYDLDASNSSGGIYYQNLDSQSNDFNSIKSDINRLNSGFNLKNLFRITYENVPAYNQSSLIASFQIILARDGSLSNGSSYSSFVLLKYTSCLSNAALRVTPGIYYILSNGQQSFNQFSYPCDSSNVNLTGTWVFDVSSGSVIFISQNFLFNFLN